MSILFVPGSLRAASYTTALLRAAASNVPDGEVVDLVSAVPYYNEDLEGDAAPESVNNARSLVAAASGLVIATPEYNGSIPGGLKNLVEWLTRPYGAHSLVGKPVAVLGGSPSPRGGRGAVEGLAAVLGFLGAKVAAEPVVVESITGRLDSHGVPDAELQAELAALVGRLTALIAA